MFEEMLIELRTQYDYIVLDTPPMGLVADSLQIASQVDGILYVSRFNYTNKELLGFVNEQYEGKKLERIGIILNDISNNTGYGYGYGYGKYYGSDEAK